MLSSTVVASATTSNALSPQISIVFKTKDAVPGGGTNAHFTSFGNPAFNDYNHVAFQATVSEVTQFPYPIVYAAPVLYAATTATKPLTTNFVPTPFTPIFPACTNTWSGIWADDASGNRQLIVRTAPPFLADIGGFSTFSDPVYNNSNTVAFIGNYNPGFIMILPGSTNFHGGTGVWISTNLFTPVAFVGEQAPGYTNNATFKSFDQIALPDQGGAVILATVTTTNYIYPPRPTNSTGPMPMYVIVQQVNQQGIWAQDTAGNLQLIAHQGGILNVGGTNKTIASLSFMNSINPVSCQTRHFSQDTGNILYKATFTDGTQAGIKVVFP